LDRLRAQWGGTLVSGWGGTKVLLTAQSTKR
jgi:hypothetical protein